MTKDTSSQGYLDLKTELRSILISSQQGCTEHQLLKDYAEYNSRKEIPFRDMGYKTLLDLLSTMPDVARIDYNRTPLTIHGVADQNTAHIKKFVMTQKRKKTTRSSRGTVNRYNNSYSSYNRTNGSSTYSRNRPPQNNYGGSTLPFQPYSQLGHVSKNQWNTFNTPPSQSYPTTSYSMPPVINNSNQNYNHQNLNEINQSSMSRTVASFPPKSTQTPPPPMSELMSIQTASMMDDNSSVMDDDLNYTEDDELASYDAQQASIHGEKIVVLRKRIRQILLKLQKGIWLSNVHKLYKKYNDEEFNLEEYKFKNLMAFFDCISDFVDSTRDPTRDSSDRILVLKPNFTEATRREQQQQFEKIESNTPVSSVTDHQNSTSTDQNSLGFIPNDIHSSIVDKSLFVPLDFHYKRIDYTSNELFNGFLGDVEDPWFLHVGNVQFISKREYMMTQLQEHYEQSLNQMIYVIPFEQLEINLSCVYYHTDQIYYRSFITQIDPMDNCDIAILKIYLVDYGTTISDIRYHMNSTNLKYLHLNFSSLPTQVYDCRLANIYYPNTSIQWEDESRQWPDESRQFIIDLCSNRNFFVEIIGSLDSFYSIYLWIDENRQQSINQLLIQHNLAIEWNDAQYSEFESIPSNIQLNTNHTNNSIDQSLLLRPKQNNIDYNMNGNNIKHFRISVEHAYYFVKHPFTGRPCLPCFEVARLLNVDENSLPQFNLIRETEIEFSKLFEKIFHDLRCIPESSKCPHINRNDNNATIIIYDLSSVRDYLIQTKFQEGDILDAFRQEYEDYERPGYWNETKNSYTNTDNLESYQENLYQRRDILNFRREQLVSLSKNYSNLSSQNEIQEIEDKLNHLHQEMHSMNSTVPSPIDHNMNLKPISSSTKIKSSNNKMRETRYRIARPFDQQFSLNIRFHHQNIDIHTVDPDDIEDRFQDLYRITKNVIQFFKLESDISDEQDRILLQEANNNLPNLISNNISLDERIGIYNYCLGIIETFQPTIRSYVQRTDLLDTIY
ncbi:unnamed protein product [Adineta steineri]|uniref:HTH OST-type domain-containing protein n=1 Tax=Adineta steineri TaxID=433720 RepID=A0A813RXK3_9BILA|nr:unnamed protein product [Adineta steineri]CAF3646774.1 unnamed protein product [Adineta steineri]